LETRSFSPKVYLRDTGILHALLGLEEMHPLRGHPKLGASREGFALEQAIVALETRDIYYWATHGGAELDLLVLAGGKRWGYEFKLADAPGPTGSMRIAMADLALDRLWVVYPGIKEYALDDRISVIGVDGLPSVATAIRSG
jgi:hypothetical protein